MGRATWGLALVLWLGGHTGVSRADDAPVVQESQVETTPKAAAASDGRRWRHSDAERPPHLEPAPPPAENYAGWLVASYLAVPALVVGLPLLIGQIGHGEGAGPAFLAGFIGGMTLPAVVHWVNGDSARGLRAILAVPAISGAGMLVGALIGGTLTSDPEVFDDGATQISNGVVGGLIGGGIAFAAWAVFDVVDTASKSNERRHSQQRGLRLAIAPTRSGVAGTLTAQF